MKALQQYQATRKLASWFVDYIVVVFVSFQPGARKKKPKKASCALVPLGLKKLEPTATLTAWCAKDNENYCFWVTTF